jgi:hypothetical protein
MSPPPSLDELVEELCARHGCHTIILYGSQAVGRAEPESDYDLLCVRSEGGPGRDVRSWRGLSIDAFIYDEASLAGELDDGFIRIRNGIVLKEKEGFGTHLLERVQVMAERGPAPMPADEITAVQSWAAKMLERIQRGDVVAHYRRVNLLTELLPLYFSMRRLWYLGPKESLAWLQSHDEEAYRTFEAALQPGAPMSALQQLVELVLLRLPSAGAA